MNGWKNIYFNNIESMFSDRGGFPLSASIPNPFLGGLKTVCPASEIELIHPETKEPHTYKLLEYAYGDYVLKYAKAEIKVGEEIYMCVWQKTEPGSMVLSVEQEPDRTVEEQAVQEKEAQFRVYRDVPEIERFLEAYKDVSFAELWREYDEFLHSTYGASTVPLLPGNGPAEAKAIFEVYEAEPIEDFITLYTLCNGHDVNVWLDKIDENGKAYAHICGNTLMNLQEIRREVQSAGRNVKSGYPLYSIPAGFVKNNEMLSNKIPIHHDGGGNFIAIDLDPDINGQYGQIILVEHEYEDRLVYASSLKEYITILFYFVKELGVINNGEDYEGDRPFSSFIQL